MSDSDIPEVAPKRQRVERQGDDPGANRRRPNQGAPRAESRRRMASDSPYHDGDSDSSDDLPLVVARRQRRAVDSSESPNVSTSEMGGLTPEVPPITQRSRPFTHELYRILENPQTQHLIKWSSSYRSILIKPNSDFVQVVRAHYRNINLDFLGFVRQLHSHGFYRVGNSEDDSNTSMWEFTHPDAKEGDKNWLQSVLASAFLTTSPRPASYMPPRSPRPSDLDERLATMDQALSDMKTQLLQSELSRANMEKGMANKLILSSDELTETRKMMGNLNDRLLKGEMQTANIRKAAEYQTGLHKEQLARTDQILNDLNERLKESETKRNDMENVVDMLSKSNAMLITAVESMVAHVGKLPPNLDTLLDHSQKRGVDFTPESQVDMKKPSDHSIQPLTRHDEGGSRTPVAGKRAQESWTLPTPVHSANSRLVPEHSPRPVADVGTSVSHEEIPWEELITSSEAANGGEASWVSQLQQLGYTSSEITDELSAWHHDGPWIVCPIKRPANSKLHVDFHLTGCVHDINYQDRLQQPNHLVDPINDTDDGEIRSQIAQLTGIGGVRVNVDGTRDVPSGSIRFIDNNTTAIVHVSLYENVLMQTLNQLLHAISLQQRVGGCCNSLTFLSIGDSQTAILHRMPLTVICNLCSFLRHNPHTTSSSLYVPLFKDIFSWVWPQETLYGMIQRFSLQHFMCLAVQFFSLAFASYTHAHCAPLRPYFLDTDLHRVILMGAQDLEQTKDGPFIRAQAAELTCFGNMLNQTVLVFEGLQNQNESYLDVHRVTSKLDILASAEDIVDTWGPGEFVTVKDDPDTLYAIRIGSGSITRVDNDNTTKLHWERNSLVSHAPTTTFDRRKKYIVGYMVTANHECKAGPVHQVLQTQGIMEEMGTFPGYWEVSERQMGFGLQAGSAAVGIAQFNQTWVKVPGRTVKSKILGQRRLFSGVLDSLMGLKLSICTGIARRVTVRQLLADVLVSYIEKLMVKPRLWQSLHKDFHIIEVLRSTIDMSRWLGERLDFEHQETFENLVYSVLYLLQDTGVDRHGRRLVVACLKPGIPFACIKIPCYGESYWARMLADSDEGATFAYLTDECLQSDAIKCPGLRFTWLNSTSLLETIVSHIATDKQVIHSGKKAVGPAFTSWSLKHQEAYLLGSLESSVLVTVDRPDEKSGPRLLVSANPLPIFLLRRMQTKFRPPRRLRESLRESRVFDRSTEVVQVLAQP